MNSSQIKWKVVEKLIQENIIRKDALRNKNSNKLLFYVLIIITLLLVFF